MTAAGHRTPAVLGDLIEIRHGWPFKSERFSEELSGRPIVVSIGNFRYTGGFRFESTTVKEYRAEYPKEFELSPGDMLLVMTCQTPGGEILGIPGRIPDDGRIYLHNQRMGKVVITVPDRVRADYLYWLFLWQDFNRDLVSTASGTKILHTAPSRIAAFKFDLPPLPEQRAIAHILGTLDDKIELNRKMNETLEAMARAIFKSWFVDFDPVRAKMEGRKPTGMDAETAALFPDRFQESELGKIPKGWEIDSVYHLARVIYGAPFASSLFNAEGNGRPLLRIRDLSTHHPGVYTPEVHAKETVIAAGDVVVGMDGEFRVVHWTGAASLLNQRVCTFQPLDGVSRMYVAQVIREPLEFFERSKTGTTVIHLGKADIDTFRVLIPSQQIQKAFTRLIDPLLGRLLVGAAESRLLRELRDTLLPKLLSGEIRIKDADRFVEGAL